MGRDPHELERKGKKGSKRENTEPYLKEQQAMITLTTNTRGSTAMEPNFKMMSGPQLVTEFNKMVESVTGWELKVKPVTRFKNTLIGIKRCEALALLMKTGKKESVATKGEAHPMTDDDDDTPDTVEEEVVVAVPAPAEEKKVKVAKAERKVKVAAVAKKKKATKKVAAPKKKKTAKEKTNGVVQEKIAVEFKARPNSYREKLLVTFYANFRKQVPVSQLLKGVYGNMNTENKAALTMVKKGMLNSIKKLNLPYQVKKDTNAETKEISFGLYPNK